MCAFQLTIITDLALGSGGFGKQKSKQGWHYSSIGLFYSVGLAGVLASAAEMLQWSKGSSK